MSDVFVSYARSTARQARGAAEALRALGYSVWIDDDLLAHHAFSQQIEVQLAAANAALVIWSADAARSDWVLSEANRAREEHKLVQVALDGVRPPMPFDRIQCTDLEGWTGDPGHQGWRKVVASIAELAGRTPPAPTPALRQSPPPRPGLCVLPFVNMSDDPEQAYFSDGITEDTITDLSKVSALFVVARNTAFTFKGRSVDVTHLARQLNVTHVLEGSVRKAGGRVRITAQLIDGATGGHVWAERFDRDLTDIFAVQDEISQAIVAALKLKLLPEEKQAIARRGTDSAEAYDLYLMARRRDFAGQGSMASFHEIVRLCGAATEIDPGYALAWALLARAQTALAARGEPGIDPSRAIEKALQLDPELAEAHVAKAVDLSHHEQESEAWAEYEIALGLDPASHEANMGAGAYHFKKGDFKRSAEYFEKVTPLEAADYQAVSQLTACYLAVGDEPRARGAASVTLERAEAAIREDPGNGSAIAAAVFALATLGQAEKAKEWAGRALVVDPENRGMRYDIACALARLNEVDEVINLLDPLLTTSSARLLGHLARDPDFDPVRQDARFQALIADAQRRAAADDPP